MIRRLGGGSLETAETVKEVLDFMRGGGNYFNNSYPGEDKYDKYERRSPHDLYHKFCSKVIKDLTYEEFCKQLYVLLKDTLYTSRWCGTTQLWVVFYDYDEFCYHLYKQSYDYEGTYDHTDKLGFNLQEFIDEQTRITG